MAVAALELRVRLGNLSPCHDCCSCEHACMHAGAGMGTNHRTGTPMQRQCFGCGQRDVGSLECRVRVWPHLVAKAAGCDPSLTWGRRCWCQCGSLWVANSGGFVELRGTCRGGLCMTFACQVPITLFGMLRGCNRHLHVHVEVVWFPGCCCRMLCCAVLLMQ